MTATAWGLLGPETLIMERRTRTLGLGASVRTFNDLAVPGLGGVWFGKQLLFATLGVAIADRLRESGRRAQNIETANAVEALACWLALSSNGWKRDPRVRGALKLFGKNDLAFSTVSKRNFYVTQPMRQSTVQPLRALGMVESSGERFNAFRCTKYGEALIDCACAGLNPYNRSVLDHLVSWAKGAHDDVRSSWSLQRALSPLDPLPEIAHEFIRERLVQGPGALRRRKALDWVESLRQKVQQPSPWNAKPMHLDEDHWRDLRAGSLFFRARDAAIALLDQIEAYIGKTVETRLSLDAALPDAVVNKLESLRERSHAFLNAAHDPSPGGEAALFCRECTENADGRLLERLLHREGHVLQQRGRDIVPGAAFRGHEAGEPGGVRSAEDEGSEEAITPVIPLPEGISHRVRNLFLLNLDLRKKLGDWLAGTSATEGGN